MGIQETNDIIYGKLDKPKGEGLNKDTYRFITPNHPNCHLRMRTMTVDAVLLARDGTKKAIILPPTNEQAAAEAKKKQNSKESQTKTHFSCQKNVELVASNQIINQQPTYVQPPANIPVHSNLTFPQINPAQYAPQPVQYMAPAPAPAPAADLWADSEQWA